MKFATAVVLVLLAFPSSFAQALNAKADAAKARGEKVRLDNKATFKP